MKTDNLNILLADDDDDDCLFFKDALDELPVPAAFNRVSNGDTLMSYLQSHTINLPHLLFLDLNMPRKTGFECLAEIKENDQLKQLPVIIYSTSSDPDILDLLYTQGAHYYIRKQADFTNLKTVIHKALSLTEQTKFAKPLKENFLIKP